MANALASLEGGGSDDSAHGPNMSGCRSRWHWPRSFTTVRKKWWSSTSSHGNRRRPVQERERSTRRTRCTKPYGGQKTPLPGTRTVSTALVPQVVLPDLGGEVVHDATKVAFLVSQTLLEREEEKRKEKEKELEQMRKLFSLRPLQVLALRGNRRRKRWTSSARYASLWHSCVATTGSREDRTRPNSLCTAIRERSGSSCGMSSR